MYIYQVIELIKKDNEKTKINVLNALQSIEDARKNISFYLPNSNIINESEFENFTKDLNLDIFNKCEIHFKNHNDSQYFWILTENKVLENR